ncbi:MAG TPA: hypothetical protein PK299_13380 [Anaerolineales bacterium]|nr:hypothetical protein [Anaerolineales bacterium]
MPENDIRTQMDFNRVRFQAFFADLMGWVQGQPKDLLCFDEVKEYLRLGGPVYRGLKTVPVSQIVGTVNRYRDFDRSFLPTQNHTRNRWQRVDHAYYAQVDLPPILLYKVGETYFVVDGNHRVSVAKAQGVEYIDAEVQECAVRVPVTAGIQMEDLEVLGEKVDFLQRTRLDELIPHEHFETSVLGGYRRLVKHIAVHRYFMGIEWNREIQADEAVLHWYENVYLPIVKVIDAHEILQCFPNATRTDLYLWVADHLHFLRERGEIVSPEDAVIGFVQQATT